MAVCLTLIVVFTIIAVYIPKELSFTSILGETDPEIIGFNKLLDSFGTHSMLIMLLEGDPEAIDKAIIAVTRDLPERSPALSVIPPADPEWFTANAPWVWPQAMFDSVISDVESGKQAPGVATMVSTADIFIHKRLRPSPNAALLNVELPGSPLDLAAGGSDFTKVESATTGILEEVHGEVTAQFAGLVAVAAQDQQGVFSRFAWITPLTLLGVLLLVYSIEPRVFRVAIAGVALAGSVMIGFGVVGLIQGRLTLGSVTFGILLLGLGIDFGIHVLVSLRDGRASGHSPDDSIHIGVEKTGEAIVFGALSSALAFGVIALVPHSFTRDIGMTALFGVLIATAMMLSLLPAAWYLLERRHVNADTPAHFRLPGLVTVVALSLKHPKKILFVGLVLLVVSVAGLPRYHMETDLEKIFSRDVPSLGVADRIREIYGTSATGYGAEVPSLEEAVVWSKKLAALPGVASVTSPSDLVKPNNDERRQRMREALESTLAADHPLAPRLQEAIDQPSPTLETLPRWLRAGIVNDEGDLALQIIMDTATLDGDIISRQIDAIREIAPTATGVPVIIRLGTMSLGKYVPYMLPSIVTAVILVLAIGFRSVKWVSLSLIPVAIGTAMTFGAYFWTDLQFSVLTAIVVPVILGLGVDDGIHVIERLRRYKHLTDENIQEAVVGVGRPIFLTTATTCVSFVGLLFVDHPGLESIAYFMLMGVPMCFIASVTFLPAAVKTLLQTETGEAQK